MLDVAPAMPEVDCDALPAGIEASVLYPVPQPTESSHAPAQGNPEEGLQRVEETLQWEVSNKFRVA